MIIYIICIHLGSISKQSCGRKSTSLKLILQQLMRCVACQVLRPDQRRCRRQVGQDGDGSDGSPWPLRARCHEARRNLQRWDEEEAWQHLATLVF